MRQPHQDNATLFLRVGEGAGAGRPPHPSVPGQLGRHLRTRKTDLSVVGVFASPVSRLGVRCVIKRQALVVEIEEVPPGGSIGIYGSILTTGLTVGRTLIEMEVGLGKEYSKRIYNRVQRR